MHSPAGILYHVCKENGWTWDYVLWGLSWSNILWGMSDGPKLNKTDPDEPIKMSPAEGRKMFNR